MTGEGLNIPAAPGALTKAPGVLTGSMRSKTYDIGQAGTASSVAQGQPVLRAEQVGMGAGADEHDESRFAFVRDPVDQQEIATNVAFT